MGARAGDSYCEIYCGACDIRLAGGTGRKSRFAAFWDEGTAADAPHLPGERRGHE